MSDLIILRAINKCAYTYGTISNVGFTEEGKWVHLSQRGIVSNRQAVHSRKANHRRLVGNKGIDGFRRLSVS